MKPDYQVFCRVFLSPSQAFISIDNLTVLPSQTAKNLGVSLDNQLSWSAQIAANACSCRFALYNICNIHPFDSCIISGSPSLPSSTLGGHLAPPLLCWFGSVSTQLRLFSSLAPQWYKELRPLLSGRPNHYHLMKTKNTPSCFKSTPN